MLKIVKMNLNKMMQQKVKKMYLQEETREYIWKKAKTIMPYTSCSVERGKYIFFFDSSDKSIANYMFRKGKLFEKREMELFFQLATKFYGYPSNQDGVFLDIGGNIGTTSIFAKATNNNLKVVAFEPSSKNAKVFKLNAVVNNFEDIELYNMALSNFNGVGELYVNNQICTDHILMMNQYRKTTEILDREIESVSVMTMDSWCEKYHFPSEQVRYICLDVEGHENAVLEGMEKLLSKNAAPMWMEISSELSRNGSAERLLVNVSKYYASFIDKRKPNKVRNIRELKQLINEFSDKNAHTDVFLIKRGLSYE